MRFLTIFNTIISAIAIVLILWVGVVYFKFTDIDPKVTLVLIDAISTQLTILEIMLMIGGLGLAFVGVWGYGNIKSFMETKIKENIEEGMGAAVNKELNQRFSKSEPFVAEDKNLSSKQELRKKEEETNG